MAETATKFDHPAFESVAELIEEITDSIGRDAWSARVDTIEFEHVPGFIPWTDGGWNGCITFGMHDETAWGCKLIRPFVEHDWELMQAEFRTEHELAGDIELDYDTHPEYEDFVTRWEQDDDSCWFVYVRAIVYGEGHHKSESGKAEVLFCFAVNDDFNYGRDSISWLGGVGSHWLWERTVIVDEITPEVLDEIRTAMFQAWRDA